MTVATHEDAPARARDLIFVKVPKQQLMWFGDTTTARRTYEVSIDALSNKGDEDLRPHRLDPGPRAGIPLLRPAGKNDGHAKLVVYSPGHRNRPIETLAVEVVG